MNIHFELQLNELMATDFNRYNPNLEYVFIVTPFRMTWINLSLNKEKWRYPLHHALLSDTRNLWPLRRCLDKHLFSFVYYHTNTVLVYEKTPLDLKNMIVLSIFGPSLLMGKLSQSTEFRCDANRLIRSKNSKKF